MTQRLHMSKYNNAIPELASQCQPSMPNLAKIKICFGSCQPQVFISFQLMLRPEYRNKAYLDI